MDLSNQPEHLIMASTKQMQERARQRRAREAIEAQAAAIKQAYPTITDGGIVHDIPTDKRKFYVEAKNAVGATHVVATGGTDFVTLLIHPNADLPLISEEQQFQTAQRLGYLLDNNRCDASAARSEAQQLAALLARNNDEEWNKRQEAPAEARTTHIILPKMTHGGRTLYVPVSALCVGGISDMERAHGLAVLLGELIPYRRNLVADSSFHLMLEYMTPGVAEHEVSGHLRHMKSGKVVSVRPHHRGI
jgi:hypothetical protein